VRDLIGNDAASERASNGHLQAKATASEHMGPRSCIVGDNRATIFLQSRAGRETVRSRE
jgi:hypothetical protein